ncbi:MAG: type II toxin-antitoxin system VapC family toxin [Asticcacaulis sp.]
MMISIYGKAADASLAADTHVWAWSIAGAPIPPRILAAIGQAEAIYVSPISLYEIGYKVRIGKWPAMEAFVARLADILQEQAGFSAALTPEVCLKAALLDWGHRDPPSTVSWRQQP